MFTCLLTLPFTASAGTVYDLQCGCYADSGNATQLALRLKELGLSWYSLPLNRCTRFILDLNVDHGEISAFMKKNPEFREAFPVKNFWDLPHPDPMRIVPIPGEEEFVAGMAPYMQQQYKQGYYNCRRLSLQKERAEMYSRFIYEAATFYGLDPFLLFAVGNFETYFRNMLGDLDRMERRHPDPAQGMFQILGSTARLIHQDMKDQKLPHTPEKIPWDLRTHPKTQVYFAAHYLGMLHQQEYGNRYMALLFYNGTLGRNYDYAKRVMRFYERALRYFIQSPKQAGATNHAMEASAFGNSDMATAQ